LEENLWSGCAICRKELPRELRYEIDDAIDFFIVEALLKKRLMEGTQPSDIHARAGKIKLLVMDVDGVLTDGGMYYSECGDELKRFATVDGMGISYLQKAGIATALVTGEKSSLLTRRSRKLSIDYVYQGVADKWQVVNKLIQTLGISSSETGYIGDDLNDFDVMNNIGFPVTVPNGHEKLKSIACYCTAKTGGSGAVREVCELILQARKA
jgi:N-acylneuraminate cytidylyltransferase